MSNATYRGGRARPGLPALAALLLAAGLVGLPAGGDAIGQTKKGAKASKESAESEPKRDNAAIQQAYAVGARSFQAGDMATAEQQLSIALAGGGLPNAQMARALYYRGSAYRRQGRPAQAISDLTTAIWLKGGLSDTLKKQATEERQLAYREAGLGSEPPPIGTAPLDQAPGAIASKPGTQVVGSGQSSFWNFLPSIPGFSSQPAQQAAAAPTLSSAVTGTTATLSAGPAQPPIAETASVVPTAAWDTQTAAHPTSESAAVAGYAPAPVPEPTGLSAVPGAPAPQGSTWNPLEGAGSTVSGFFGNVFGTGGSQTASVSPQATGATWGSETTVVTAQTSSMVQRGPDVPVETSSNAHELPWSGPQSAAAVAPEAVASEAQAPQKTAAVARATGAYKLQVAAVRSREEAEKLAVTLQSYDPVQQGTVSTEIDEAVIGSMGTFYRVRLGPYANAKEPDALCKTLRPQGFDCMVVTQ